MNLSAKGREKARQAGCTLWMVFDKMDRSRFRSAPAGSSMNDDGALSVMDELDGHLNPIRKCEAASNHTAEITESVSA